MSALELMRMVGVCYRTAWSLKNQILALMARREANRKLDGTVVMDDICLGGKCHGKLRRGTMKTFGRARVDASAARHLAPTNTVVSDGLDCFSALVRGGRTH